VTDATISPRISVVVPTRNRPDFVCDLLVALQKSELKDFELLLMDQTDSDATESVVRQFGDPRFHYHRMTRVGACPARNLGAALAAAPIVVFTDDDCAPAPDWLSRIAAAFDEDPALQFAFGALDAAPCDYSVGSVPSFDPDPALERGRKRRRLMTAASGANMVCRKSFLREHGAFDEVLGPNAPAVRNDDASMCYKVLRSTSRWQMRPDIRTLHLHGFRPWPQIWDIYRGQMFGSGANYARFVRRGDAYAFWIFLHELRDMLGRPLRALARLRRPDGAGYVAEYLRGFWHGIRIRGHVGYVGGAEFQRMERTRTLDVPGREK
jgi:glycosyltransferase involved in cell wall biosynthesis